MTPPNKPKQLTPQIFILTALLSSTPALSTPPKTPTPNNEPTLNVAEHKNRIFSNFYLLTTPLTDQHGIQYPTVEHAYHAKKTKNIDQKKIIAQRIETPAPWAGLGALRAYRSLIGSKKFETDPEFRKNRVEIMEKLLREKFEQSPFQEQLIQTYPKKLLYIDKKGRDLFWAITPEGVGENKLGLLLEKIRQELVDKKKLSPNKNPPIAKPKG